MRHTRRGTSRRDRNPPPSQLPFNVPTNHVSPVDILTQDQLDQIHERAVNLLETYGVELMDDETQTLAAAAGCRVNRETGRTQMPRSIVMDAVATAPSSFTLKSRDPAFDVPLGGDRMAFASVSSAPNVSDLEGGRRPGNFADFKKLVTLSSALNIIHLGGGYPVEPTDIPPGVRHLDCIDWIIRQSPKPFRISAIGAERVEDGLAMTKIAHGLDHDQLTAGPRLLTIINVNSPLRFDGAMLQGLIAMARHNQAVAVTPFTLSGAMAPASISGALLQQNAEALAGITITQLVRPGAPVLYGCFTSNVDMKSGAPAFGTPENTQAIIAAGQLARRYDVPYRVSNANASNAVDAQAAYESQMSLWAAVLGGGHFVHHAAGWMEGGLTASYEKMVIDAEMLQMLATTIQPIDTSDLDEAMDAIMEVGPGGHFFGAAHTLKRFEHGFYPPLVSDWRNFESWQEAGAKDAAARASEIADQLISEYDAPPLDPGLLHQLSEFVDRRKEQGGVSN